MFASRIKPNVFSDPMLLAGGFVAALAEELEAAVSPPVVVGGARHGGCPTASAATARATSNRPAVASNQGADFGGKAPEEALAGSALSLVCAFDFTGQCTIFEPADCVCDWSNACANRLLL